MGIIKDCVKSIIPPIVAKQVYRVYGVRGIDYGVMGYSAGQQWVTQLASNGYLYRRSYQMTSNHQHELTSLLVDVNMTLSYPENSLLASVN